MVNDGWGDLVGSWDFSMAFGQWSGYWSTVVIIQFISDRHLVYKRFRDLHCHHSMRILEYLLNINFHICISAPHCVRCQSEERRHLGNLQSELSGRQLRGWVIWVIITLSWASSDQWPSPSLMTGSDPGYRVFPVAESRWTTRSHNNIS